MAWCGAGGSGGDGNGGGGGGGGADGAGLVGGLAGGRVGGVVETLTTWPPAMPSTAGGFTNATAKAWVVFPGTSPGGVRQPVALASTSNPGRKDSDTASLRHTPPNWLKFVREPKP